MSQELQDFIHFKEHQLHYFNEVTGRIDTVGGRWGNRVFEDVGSENEDGYVRLWTNGRLRMKHRLVHFLVKGELPADGHEIDHKNDQRNDNRPSNIHSVPKSVNNTGCADRKFGRQFTKEEVIEVCKLLAETNLSDLAIANKTGFSRATVRDIKTRRSRASTSQGYVWPHRV